jgi:tRNA(fMet)-specific endonuclease VapC
VIVADSDVLIDALRGRDPAAGLVARELKAGTLATTVISAFELLSGARSDDTREKIERFLAPITVLALDDSAARAAASIRSALDVAGTPIGTADYLIAGICVQRSTTLLTRNRAHFEKVPDLLLGDL